MQHLPLWRRERPVIGRSGYSTLQILQHFVEQAFFAHEGWKAPIYKTGLQNDNVIQARITWFPEKQKTF